MITSPQLSTIIKNAKIIGPDTKFIIDGTRGFYRGYCCVEVNGIILKIKEKDVIQRASDDARHLNIRRKILKVIDPKLNQNAVRISLIRVPFFDLVDKIILIADSAAALKTQSEDPSVTIEKVQKYLATKAAKEKIKNTKYAMEQLEGLFQGPLFDMEEEELIEVFRLNRVKHVMES